MITNLFPAVTLAFCLAAASGFAQPLPTRSAPTARALSSKDAQRPVDLGQNVENVSMKLDPILQALVRITAKLDAIEAKQTALENQLKALPSANNQTTAMKNEIIGAIASNRVPPSATKDTLDYLKAIHESVKSLPTDNWEPKYWWDIYQSSTFLYYQATH